MIATRVCYVAPRRNATECYKCYTCYALPKCSGSGSASVASTIAAALVGWRGPISVDTSVRCSSEYLGFCMWIWQRFISEELGDER